MPSERKKESSIGSNVATIVLAGGQGTRLFPLTANRCKPAVAFGGRYRLIDIPISNSLNSKIRQIFVISQYFASDLHQHITSTYQLDRFREGGIELLTPQETPEGKNWYKGTADAVRQNLDFLLKTPAEYFLILSGDQLYNMDLVRMIQFAKKEDADLVIAALPVKEAEARRMGLLKIDSASRITDFYEKPQEAAQLKYFQLPEKADPPHYLGSMGIYVFKRSAIASLAEETGDDFGKHLIPTLIKKSKSSAFVYDGYWEDIGTVASYYQANLALTTQRNCLDTYNENNPIFSQPYNIPGAMIRGTKVKNSIISQGAIVEAEEITHSVVGIRSQIGKGTIIRDSIIIGNRFYHPPEHLRAQLPTHLTIGQNCLIEKAIVDEHTSIGNHVQLINKQNIQKMDGDGIYIREGIIIVMPGTSLPDGFIL